MRRVPAAAASSDDEQRSGRCRGVAPATLSAATDLLIADYVAWREARTRVRGAYAIWAHTSGHAKAAFAAYLAALDHEEKAAGGYARSIERVRRFVSAGSDGEPEDGT